MYEKQRQPSFFSFSNIVNEEKGSRFKFQFNAARRDEGKQTGTFIIYDNVWSDFNLFQGEKVCPTFQRKYNDLYPFVPIPTVNSNHTLNCYICTREHIHFSRKEGGKRWVYGNGTRFNTGEYIFSLNCTLFRHTFMFVLSRGEEKQIRMIVNASKCL